MSGDRPLEFSEAYEEAVTPAVSGDLVERPDIETLLRTFGWGIKAEDFQAVCEYALAAERRVGELEAALEGALRIHGLREYVRRLPDHVSTEADSEAANLERQARAALAAGGGQTGTSDAG